MDRLGELKPAERLLRELDEGPHLMRAASPAQRALLKIYLARILTDQGRWDEADRWTNELLGSADVAAAAETRIAAHRLRGEVLYYRGEYAESLRHHDLALATAREIGRRREIALEMVRRAKRPRNDPRPPRGGGRRLPDGVAELRELGDDAEAAYALVYLGVVVAQHGHLDESIVALHEAVGLAERAHDLRRVGWALFNIGDVERERGNLPEAETATNRARENPREDRGPVRPRADVHHRGEDPPGPPGVRRGRTAAPRGVPDRPRAQGPRRRARGRAPPGRGRPRPRRPGDRENPRRPARPGRGRPVPPRPRRRLPPTARRHRGGRWPRPVTGPRPAPVRRAAERALAEDRWRRDVTTQAVVPASQRATGRISAQASGVVSGLVVADAVARAAGLRVRRRARNGDSIRPGTVVLELSGNARSLLAVERTVLNFLMHLSGVASATAAARTEIGADGPMVYATRKTLPGLRDLEKDAVRHGGGRPHRRDLSDGILVKNNHLALVPLRTAVERSRRSARGRTVQVEVRTLAEARAAVKAGAEALLIDNATPARARGIVRGLAAAGQRAGVHIELSGGITPANARSYRATGADAVSLGSLTHSAAALPFHMTVVPDR